MTLGLWWGLRSPGCRSCWSRSAKWSFDGNARKTRVSQHITLTRCTSFLVSGAVGYLSRRRWASRPIRAHVIQGSRWEILSATWRMPNCRVTLTSGRKVFAETEGLSFGAFAPLWPFSFDYETVSDTYSSPLTWCISLFAFPSIWSALVSDAWPQREHSASCRSFYWTLVSSVSEFRVPI